MWLRLMLVGSLFVPPAEAAKPTRVEFAKSVCSAVEAAANENALDRVFFARLLWRESLFDPNAVSPKGAQGIAQFMPETAERRDLADPFEPLAAVAASANFLADLKQQFGNLGLAAAAYNAGEQRITDWLAGKRGLPEETRDYVEFITGRAATDWKVQNASFTMPPLGASGDFATQCISLAARDASLKAVGVKTARAQPWGALLAADFNEMRALSMYRRLKLRFPQVLKDREPMVVRLRNLSRGSRKMALVMIGAKTRIEAQDLCSRYTAAGLPCVVKKSR